MSGQLAIQKNYSKAVILYNGSDKSSECVAIEQQIFSRFIKISAAKAIKEECLRVIMKQIVKKNYTVLRKFMWVKQLITGM